jgi:CDP-glycerol glycerophosphotransferase (TagB/SpsB family)
MVSNQVKAYDRVFVAGQAAVLRHRAALSEFNEEVLVRVGRPQLDENPSPSIPESSRRTVLYAPTWSGEDEANNYTSMEYMGSFIIDAVLAQDNVRVIYKPHPRIADSDDQNIRKNHAHILRAIKQANSQDSTAGHEVRETGDILAVFPRIDLLISDVSSIALDFLYLRTEAPIILTDRRNDVNQLRIDSPLSAATPVLTKDNISDAKQIIGDVLTSDDFVQDRKVLREFYFDNVQTGESAPRFFEAMNQVIAAHSADMARAQSLAESGTGPRFEHRT